MDKMAERNTGRGNGATFLKLVATAMVLLTMLACGEATQSPESTSAPPPGMFSQLPTNEPPILGDQPPVIELNTPEPTLTPNPTYTPVPKPAPLPTDTPIPNPATAPGPTAAFNPTIAPGPTAAFNPTIAPGPTAAFNPTIAPGPTAAFNPTTTPGPTAAFNPTTAPGPTAAFNPTTAIVPGSPAGLTARADGETEIDLSWSKPSSDGGAPVTSNRIEVSDIGSNWSVLEPDTGSSGTSFTHRGLTGGSTRHYRVSAINSAGVGPPSNTANATTDASATVPGSPAGLSASADGEMEIDLSWREPGSDGGSLVTGYRIEVSDSGSNWSVLAADTSSSRTSYTHRGLTGGSTRYYRMSAINSAGVGQPSNTANATTDASATVPGSPAGLSAGADGETEIDLSWREPRSDGGSLVTGYRIEVSNNGSNWSVLEADTSSSRTSYTHRGLTGGSTRHYRVSAINSAGVGQPSNTASATTDASATVPGSPAGLSASADGEKEIDLSWKEPSSDGGSRVTGYRIELSNNGSNWSALEADTGSSRTSFTHRGLTGGSTRHYRVSAINSAGVGPPSNTASATTDASATVPGSPAGLRASADGEKEIDLSWREPSSDGGSRVTGYRIELSNNGSNWSALEADTGSRRTSYTHRGLTGGSTRHYRVSAINSTGVGQSSNTASATTDASATVPGSPAGLRASADGETEIDLSWREPSSDGGSRVTGYRIEVSDNGSNWSVLEADTGSSRTSYTHRGLTGGSTRHYRVSAINSAGVGQSSNTASATTDTPEPCEGMTLEQAIKGRHTAVVQCLVDRGTDVNAKGSDGNPLLHRAIRGNFIDIVRILVVAGADPSAKDVEDDPMLNQAIKGNFIEIVEILVDEGADVDARNGDDNPLLRQAIFGQFTDIVRILVVDGNADVNAKTADGDPLLTLAKRTGNAEIIEILEDAGATE